VASQTYAALSAKQSKPTEETLKAVDHLLGYVKAHPDNGELYRKSDMQLMSSRRRARKVNG